MEQDLVEIRCRQQCNKSASARRRTIKSTVKDGRLRGQDPVAALTSLMR